MGRSFALTGTNDHVSLKSQQNIFEAICINKTLGEDENNKKREPFVRQIFGENNHSFSVECFLNSGCSINDINIILKTSLNRH